MLCPLIHAVQCKLNTRGHDIWMQNNSNYTDFEPFLHLVPQVLDLLNFAVNFLWCSETHSAPGIITRGQPTSLSKELELLRQWSSAQQQTSPHKGVAQTAQLYLSETQTSRLTLKFSLSAQAAQHNIWHVFGRFFASCTQLKLSSHHIRQSRVVFNVSTNYSTFILTLQYGWTKNLVYVDKLSTRWNAFGSHILDFWYYCISFLWIQEWSDLIISLH